MKYQTLVYNLILKSVGNKTDTEELVQNVFVNAFSHLSSFGRRSRLSTWLCGIAVNQIRNYRRKKRSKRVYAESDMQPLSGGELFDICQCAGADQAISEEKTKLLVDELIAELPPFQREVFILHYIIGLSCEETATVLHTSIAHIKIQLFRGRKYLFSKFFR